MSIKNGFTMIELVFVIVVLGILAAVAVPRFAATRDDAHVAKGRADVASVRSGIITERQSRLFRGQSAFITALDSGVGNNVGGVTIFDNNGSVANTILQYGITTGTTDGHWVKSGVNQYTFLMQGGNNNAVFTYCPLVTPGCPVAGVFDCAPGNMCSKLTD